MEVKNKTNVSRDDSERVLSAIEYWSR